MVALLHVLTLASGGLPSAAEGQQPYPAPSSRREEQKSFSSEDWDPVPGSGSMPDQVPATHRRAEILSQLQDMESDLPYGRRLSEITPKAGPGRSPRASQWAL